MRFCDRIKRLEAGVGVDRGVIQEACLLLSRLMSTEGGAGTAYETEEQSKPLTPEEKERLTNLIKIIQGY
jgi:hypothetical protein